MTAPDFDAIAADLASCAAPGTQSLVVDVPRAEGLLERFDAALAGATPTSEQALALAWSLVGLARRWPDRAAQAERLARRAMDAGVAGAGPVVAKAVDFQRMHETSGRQRYGTVPHKTHGELQFPYFIDNDVTDDERFALGLGTVAEARRALMEANLEQARRRAGEPLNDDEELRRVVRDEDTSQIRARTAVENPAI